MNARAHGNVMADVAEIVFLNRKLGKISLAQVINLLHQVQKQEASQWYEAVALLLDRAVASWSRGPWFESLPSDISLTILLM